MRFSKLLPLVLIILALFLSVCGCKKAVAETETESSSEKAASYSIEEIEKKAADSGYVCNYKEDAGIQEINEDIDVSEANGILVGCMEISSSSDHTRAIIFEFDSEESASEFCEASEALFGRLGEGISKDCRGHLFIYGDTSVIENIW